MFGSCLFFDSLQSELDIVSRVSHRHLIFHTDDLNWLYRNLSRQADRDRQINNKRGRQMTKQGRRRRKTQGRLHSIQNHSSPYPIWHEQ